MVTFPVQTQASSALETSCCAPAPQLLSSFTAPERAAPLQAYDAEMKDEALLRKMKKKNPKYTRTSDKDAAPAPAAAEGGDVQGAGAAAEQAPRKKRGGKAWAKINPVYLDGEAPDPDEIEEGTKQGDDEMGYSALDQTKWGSSVAARMDAERSDRAEAERRARKEEAQELRGRQLAAALSQALLQQRSQGDMQ
jgi:hypothetical protein